MYLREALLTERITRLHNVQRVLQRLRRVKSVSELVDQAPAENARLGFPRTLVSRIQDSLWVARSGHVEYDPKLGDALVQTGIENPRRLGPELVETEMVRRRRSILVENPQSNPRVHRDLVDVVECQSYVGAPIMTNDTVVGFIHADSNERDVDESDRDLLALFAEGLSNAMERAILFERLHGIRSRINEYTSSVADMVEEFACADLRMSSLDTEAHEDPGAYRHGGPVNPVMDQYSLDNDLGLTRRELDTLRHMAAGETNSRIADSLVIAEGTVKFHVKHILRKLNASNRAEAVSRYLGLVHKEQRRRG